MPIECELDFKNNWGYIYCDVCEEVSLIGMMSSEELFKELEKFKEIHDHL